MRIFNSNRKEKIFCIGTGKTGTTSVEKALRDFGYKMGNQPKGELLLKEYSKRNFKKIIDFCYTADAFQDAPFCFKYTYIAIDQEFSNAKFILTVRNSDEEWYNSLLKFHSKRHNNRNEVPTIEDLKNATYRYKGYAWDVRRLIYGIEEGQNPYDENVFKQYYNDHNNAILDYFKHKDNLLVINLSQKDSYQKLCDFLGRKPLYDEFPWENKTAEIKSN